MPAHHTRLSIIQAAIVGPEEGKENETDSIKLILTSGTPLPVSADGTNPIVVPIGTYEAELSGDVAVQLGEKLVEEGQKIPKKSAIETASNLSGVEQLAQQARTVDKAFRG